jgi:hypothetical protein
MRKHKEGQAKEKKKLGIRADARHKEENRERKKTNIVERLSWGIRANRDFGNSTRPLSVPLFLYLLGNEPVRPQGRTKTMLG